MGSPSPGLATLGLCCPDPRLLSRSVVAVAAAAAAAAAVDEVVVEAMVATIDGDLGGEEIMDEMLCVCLWPELEVLGGIALGETNGLEAEDIVGPAAAGGPRDVVFKCCCCYCCYCSDDNLGRWGPAASGGSHGVAAIRLSP